MDLHESLSRQVGYLLRDRGLILATAESCTGGAVAASVTAIPGSSDWFDRAFITYSNEAKMDMLGVREETLRAHGAVSEETVVEMVNGALDYSGASVAVAISGIAGPGGGSEEKPVGTVCFSWESLDGWEKTETVHFSGDRTQVRVKAVYHALLVLQNHLSEGNECLPGVSGDQ